MSVAMTDREKELRAQRASLYAAGMALLDKTERERRPLTAYERERDDANTDQLEALAAEIDALFVARWGLNVSPVARRSVADSLPGDTWSGEELAFVDLVNQHRADNGLPPLSLSFALTAPARWKAQHDTRSRTWRAHGDRLGRSFGARMGDFGTPNASEIVCGNNYDSRAIQAFEQFRTSPPHNGAMLDPAYDAIGVSRAIGRVGLYQNHWAAALGELAADEQCRRGSSESEMVFMRRALSRRRQLEATLASTLGRHRHTI